MSVEDDVERILKSIEAGNMQASDDLLPIVYESLRGLASKLLAGESAAHTLQPTAVVHESYLRLIASNAGSDRRWESLGHFYAAAARAMRRVLTDHARRKGARKRGGDINRLSLDAFVPSAATSAEEILDIDAALTELERYDSRQARIVNLRIFAGLTNQETATLCDLSLATVEREWSYAKLWLYARLQSLREGREEEPSA